MTKSERERQARMDTEGSQNIIILENYESNHKNRKRWRERERERESERERERERE